MEPEKAFENPTFVAHLNDVLCDEEGQARFECSLEPKNDPNMKIEWQLNGKPIHCGSRIQASADFGLVSLDIQGVQPTDAGVFTCLAENKAGKTSTSGTLKVNPIGDVISTSQHPAGKSVMDSLKDLEGSIAIQLEPESSVEEPVSFQKPVFTTQFPDKLSVDPESRLLHLECNVEPKNDPRLKINWYHNGLPLPSATRIMPTRDFGFVTLDIKDISARDNGVYTCKAVNDSGEAVIFTTVEASGSSGIDADVKHPRGKEGMNAISEFESKMTLPDQESTEQESGKAPEFVKPFQEGVKVTEGDRAYFEAQLEPKTDPNISLSWTFNGKPLQESSRYKKVHSFGMVILDIGNVSTTDAGSYTCTATNKLGSASTSVKLDFVEEKSSHCPKFEGKLEDHLELFDGQSVHLQCALSPVNDPDLKVEWLFNNKPMSHSSRLKTVADFGYVMLDIAGVDSQDTGKYTCRAWNK